LSYPEIARDAWRKKEGLGGLCIPSQAGSRASTSLQAAQAASVANFGEEDGVMVFRCGLLVAALVCLASPAQCQDSKPAELNQLRLYIPIPQLEDRFGKDVKPLRNYIKALEKRASEILAKEKQPGAKGLLIAAGIKSKKNTRIWCQAVEGDIPEALLRKLEKELARVEAVDLKKGPAGFAMEVKLFGHKPEKYPEFPQSWEAAAKKSETKLLVPPDDLFKIIWPD
jgi:hypothetical protein